MTLNRPSDFDAVTDRASRDAALALGVVQAQDHMNEWIQAACDDGLRVACDIRTPLTCGCPELYLRVWRP